MFNFAGKNAFIWIGPEPLVTILNPKDIKDRMNNYLDFQRPSNNPLTKYLISGPPSHEGDKWAKHRKIINPAFHVEKVKVICLFSLLFFYLFSSFYFIHACHVLFNLIVVNVFISDCQLIKMVGTWNFKFGRLLVNR